MEENVTCFSCGDGSRSRRCLFFGERFFLFLFLQNPRIKRRKLSTPASIKPVNTLWRTDTILPFVTTATAWHITQPDHYLSCVGSIFYNIYESCWRNADCMWWFNETGNGKEIQIFGKWERRDVVCVCSALLSFASQKLLFKAKVQHFGKYV